MPRTFWQRHKFLKWFLIVLLIVLVLLGIAIGIAARHAEPFLRTLIVQRLAERFHARVELDSFHISLAHGLRAQGKGLRIWPPADVEGVTVPGTNQAPKPLISLAEFHFRAPLHYASGKPIHISGITLEGLTVDVPPRPHLTHEPEPDASTPAQSGSQPLDRLQFQIDNVTCNNASLTLETSDPRKQPLKFDIKTIRIAHISPNGSMAFHAELTNPRPQGVVTTQGTLGPWKVEDPGQTPVAGDYRFDHADLSVFRGIAGMLSSTGKYEGALRDLTVDGQTDTPDFALTKFGSALPLHTTFHARVDGTNGDTWLEPVHATLGHTQFTARGKVVQAGETAAQARGTQRRRGHDIVLTVDVPHGDIGDFLRLTSKSGQPLLNGTLQMKTDFELPPGANPVHERMRLKGSFRLQDAQFSNAKLQERIGELSLRGQGKPDDAKTAAALDVRSAMEGDFSIADGKVNLPHLVYIVPGAEIDLNGTYGMDGESLEFRGTARMQATISHLVGGWKGWLLKPVDPFFRKDGAGTKVRVHVYGTRQDPQFGVDF